MANEEIHAKKADIAPHAHYMRPLDGIRGMACLFVVAAHIVILFKIDELPEWGSMGVVIFFVLSGFLMSTLYADTKFSLDASVKYMIARFTRIAPPYWVAVLFAWALYMYMPTYAYQMTPFQMLRSVFFGGNQGVFWSIPPEIQFYVFFLLLWFSWGKWKAGNRTWGIVAILLSLAMLVTREQWGGLMLPSKLHIFLYGFGAAFLVKSKAISAQLCTLPAQVLLSIVTIVYGYCIVTEQSLYVELVFPGLVGLWVASMSRSTLFTKPFETDTMRLMGAASFSVYLFHDALLRFFADLGVFHYNIFVNIMLSVLLCLVPPIAFHVLCEKRLNKASKEAALTCFEKIKARWPALAKA
ncbi:MAG: hypothetical protein DI551_06870 [Micavibrio aeruginosavorus]|uniref:Acyltransferase 3 domain-containing protein n=1 Tax=Micavibrio aeruginosavorus TaxID=349221 RepID=A0A2W5N4D3_9BACT|nr:MAG: hypothetical protein DI551_06870 [Micavibrio aeruginosavorus]